MNKKEKNMEKPCLSLAVPVKVRFSEVDSLKIVWHGSYVKYLEDAREAFGEKYGLEYMYMYNSGYVAPIVDMHFKYFNSARVGDRLSVEITYKPTRASKLIFNYKIYRESDGVLLSEAQTIQLFQNLEGVFEVSNPDFYAEWKLYHNQ